MTYLPCVGISSPLVNAATAAAAAGTRLPAGTSTASRRTAAAAQHHIAACGLCTLAASRHAVSIGTQLGALIT